MNWRLYVLAIGLPLTLLTAVIACFAVVTWAVVDTMSGVGEPEPFVSIEGKKGWKVVVRARQPLATPAVAGKQVLLGGGFATYAFHSLDAATGKRLWTHAAADNGPTAAAVEDGYIVYNTESCRLEVITTGGAKVWSKWLGDPLMSTPTVANGRIYTSYPRTFGGSDYQFACFDLRTGTVLWQRAIAGEVITSATHDNNRIYFATVDGTLACLDSGDGAMIWQEQANALSSPQIVGACCYFQRRFVDGDASGEGLASRGTDAAAPLKNLPATWRGTDGLNAQPSDTEFYSSLDRSVGWSGDGHFGSASLIDARRNLGLSTISAIWSFQGSRPFLHRGLLYRSTANVVQCVDPVRAEVVWTKDLPAAGAITPPALANDKLFVGTAAGSLLCLSADNGDVLWQATVGEPISAQVTVALGRVYVPTRFGSLFCIETDNLNDHGWLTWGGNAARDGIIKR